MKKTIKTVYEYDYNGTLFRKTVEEITEDDTVATSSAHMDEMATDNLQGLQQQIF